MTDFTAIVTVADVYGKPINELALPSGFELTGRFVPPISNPKSWFLCNGEPGAYQGMAVRLPQVELRKLPETERLVIEVPKGAKVHCFVEGERRRPKCGDLFVKPNDWVCQAAVDFEQVLYPILRRVEPKPCS